MKKLMILPVLIVLSSGSALAAGTPPDVGYVDLRQVVLDSTPGKHNKAVLEKFVSQKQAALAKEKDRLEALQKAYQKDEMVLTDDQKKARRQEIEQRVQAFRKMVADAKDALGRKDAEFSGQAIQQIRTIVAGVAQRHRVALVLDMPEQAVLYAAPGVDLTAAVLRRYNATPAK